MSIERFHTNDRMSQMVIHGDTVYLAGQVALGAPGESVADQTRAILGQIDSLLAEAGTDKSKALTATIWLCSMDDFAEMNAVWDAWATGGNAPCRACVESPRLASPDFTVRMQISADLTFDASDPVIAEEVVPGLGPNSTGAVAGLTGRVPPDESLFSAPVSSA